MQAVQFIPRPGRSMCQVFEADQGVSREKHPFLHRQQSSAQLCWGPGRRVTVTEAGVQGRHGPVGFSRGPRCVGRMEPGTLFRLPWGSMLTPLLGHQHPRLCQAGAPLPAPLHCSFAPATGGAAPQDGDPHHDGLTGSCPDLREGSRPAPRLAEWGSG